MTSQKYGIGTEKRVVILALMRIPPFLFGKIEHLTDHPSAGIPVPERTGVRRFTAKRRSKGHGHIIFYIALVDRIVVVRVLHTAQDWPQIL